MRSRRKSFHWLTSKGPNYQRGVLLISAGAIEVYFEGKTPREDQQGGLVLARQCLDSPVTCHPEENGLPGLSVSLSTTLFSIYNPIGLPPVPWTEKRIEWSPFFLRSGGHCYRGDQVGPIIIWFFFWVACKSYSRGLKGLNVYWASCGVCWINPEFGCCTLFSSWSGLSAPPRNLIFRFLVHGSLLLAKIIGCSRNFEIDEYETL